MSIKLIAADLDGTLLDSQKRFSPGLFTVIRALRERGVIFAPASGRQYYNLREMFAPIADELSYISENGAMVCNGTEIVTFEEMPVAEVQRVLQKARTINGVSVILSCRDKCYFENDQDEVFLKNMALYYARRVHVPDLLTVIEYEPVCKIAFYGENLAEDIMFPILRVFEGSSHVTLSGADWVDVMRPGMNKGRAVTALRKKLGITVEECMAFGDYLNDLELLESVGESYAMDNAHPTLKAVAKHICPSNDEDGVCKTLREVFGL